MTDGAVATSLEQGACGPVDVQNRVLDNDPGLLHCLQLLGRTTLGEPDDQRPDALPEPVRVDVAVGLEAPVTVVLEGGVADHGCAVLDDPGVALRVGERAPVVRHVLLGPVARAGERKVERLTQSDDCREVLAPRRANRRRHVTAAGSSAAATASTSAGTSIVATAGTTASIVFSPSPVM